MLLPFFLYVWIINFLFLLGLAVFRKMRPQRCFGKCAPQRFVSIKFNQSENRSAIFLLCIPDVTTSLFVFFLLLLYSLQNLFQLLESLPICSIFMSLHSHTKCIIFAALSLHTIHIFSCFLFLYSSISDSVFVFNQNLSVCGWYFSIILSGSM